MHVTAHAIHDQFSEARMEFEDLIAQLLSLTAAGLTHSQAEDLIKGQGREALRQLLQGWLESRGTGDVGPALVGQDGVRRTQRRLHSRARALWLPRRLGPRPAVNHVAGTATPIGRNEKRPEAKSQASADVVAATATYPSGCLAVPGSPTNPCSRDK